MSILKRDPAELIRNPNTKTPEARYYIRKLLAPERFMFLASGSWFNFAKFYHKYSSWDFPFDINGIELKCKYKIIDISTKDVLLEGNKWSYVNILIVAENMRNPSSRIAFTMEYNDRELLFTIRTIKVINGVVRPDYEKLIVSPYNTFHPNTSCIEYQIFRETGYEIMKRYLYTRTPPLYHQKDYWDEVAEIIPKFP